MGNRAELRQECCSSVCCTNDILHLFTDDHDARASTIGASEFHHRFGCEDIRLNPPKSALLIEGLTGAGVPCRRE